MSRMGLVANVCLNVFVKKILILHYNYHQFVDLIFIDSQCYDMNSNSKQLCAFYFESVGLLEMSGEFYVRKPIMKNTNCMTRRRRKKLMSQVERSPTNMWLLWQNQTAMNGRRYRSQTAPAQFTKRRLRYKTQMISAYWKAPICRQRLQHGFCLRNASFTYGSDSTGISWVVFLAWVENRPLISGVARTCFRSSSVLNFSFCSRAKDPRPSATIRRTEKHEMSRDNALWMGLKFFKQFFDGSSFICTYQGVSESSPFPKVFACCTHDIRSSCSNLAWTWRVRTYVYQMKEKVCNFLSSNAALIGRELAILQGRWQAKSA